MCEIDSFLNHENNFIGSGVGLLSLQYGGAVVRTQLNSYLNTSIPVVTNF